MARKQTRILSRWLASAALLAGATLAQPAMAAPSPPRDPEMRLAQVGYRLALANADRCSQHDMLTGLLLHDLTEYARADRADAAQRFDLGNGIGVLAVVPDSAAQRAGVRSRDEIVAINGVAIADPASMDRSAGSFDRMRAFLDDLDQRVRRGPVALDIRRGGARVSLTLNADVGCSGQFSLKASHALNAWSDGHYVAVTTRLMSFANSDDELAFVVAHEMAHNILGHQTLLKAQQTGLFWNSDAAVISVKSTEIEADQFAIRLMADARYDVAAASDFLRKSRGVRWLDIAIDHPGIGRRLMLVASAVERLQADHALHPPEGRRPTAVPTFSARDVRPALMTIPVPAITDAGSATLAGPATKCPAGTPGAGTGFSPMPFGSGSLKNEPAPFATVANGLAALPGASLTRLSAGVAHPCSATRSPNVGYASLAPMRPLGYSPAGGTANTLFRRF